MTVSSCCFVNNDTQIYIFNVKRLTPLFFSLPLPQLTQKEWYLDNVLYFASY